MGKVCVWMYVSRGHQGLSLAPRSEDRSVAMAQMRPQAFIKDNASAHRSQANKLQVSSQIWVLLQPHDLAVAGEP
jgi:hypothetical protein